MTALDYDDLVAINLALEHYAIDTRQRILEFGESDEPVFRPYIKLLQENRQWILQAQKKVRGMMSIMEVTGRM